MNIISTINIEATAGTTIDQLLQVAIEIAEKYNCNVEIKFNDTPLIVGPNRVSDLMKLWQLERSSR